MALILVAESPADFERWLEAQRRPAARPQESLAVEGEKAFETKSCALCHTVRGTEAAGRLGPDLTHLATRRQIAAGRLPNTRGPLAAWIIDPQSLKPGSRMPATPLDARELDALLAYLEGLA